jgi:acyl-CoA hydrolase
MPDLSPKRAADSATEMVQVVLPNDANPLGFILGGTVMHLIDIAGAIAAIVTPARCSSPPRSTTCSFCVRSKSAT